MQHCFLDTNIILDLLVKDRLESYPETEDLFTKAEKKELKLSCSALSLVNIHYLLKPSLSEAKLRLMISELRQIVSVVPLNESTLDLALNSPINDFEDAVQHASAQQHSADLILSRNLKDFKKSALPCFTVKAYLNTFEN